MNRAAREIIGSNVRGESGEGGNTHERMRAKIQDVYRKLEVDMGISPYERAYVPVLRIIPGPTMNNYHHVSIAMIGADPDATYLCVLVGSGSRLKARDG